MSDDVFSKMVDEIESTLTGMEKAKRQKYQYDEETVLTMTEEQRKLILKNLRVLEREYYRSH